MNLKEITILYKNCYNTQCWKQCALDKDKFKHLKRNQLMYVFDCNMRLLKQIETWDELEKYIDEKLKEKVKVRNDRNSITTVSDNGNCSIHMVM